MNTPRPGFRLRAAWAAILSLIVPGLGQIYARAWRLGIVLVVVNEALSLAARLVSSRSPPTVPDIGAVVLVILLSLVLMLGAAIDAARRLLKAGPGPGRTAVARPRWFRSTWLAAAVLLALGFGVNAAIPFRWRSFNVSSGSMIPSLMVGDDIVTDVRPGVHIRRGDIVVFLHPVAAPASGAATPPSAIFVKRVIGAPGDRIAIRDGRVVLNGQPLPRRDDGDFNIPQYMSFGLKAHRWTETLPGGISYQVVTTPNAPAVTTPEITVPPGQTFVLGDNRDNSVDSHTPGFGTVSISEVLGKAQTIYWSLDRNRVMTPVP